jgi:hypothetical protein
MGAPRSKQNKPLKMRLFGRPHKNSQKLVAEAELSNYMQIEIEPFPLVA